MNATIPSYAIYCVCRQIRNQTKYVLFRLKEEETEEYAVWIQNREEHALAALGADSAGAEQAFWQAVEGELSPLHLYDWASDRQREREESRFCEKELGKI